VNEFFSSGFSDVIVNVAYLIASILFLRGLKGMTHPRTAVRGNQLAALGMFLAVGVTLIDQRVISFELVIAGVVVGGVIGAIIAARVQMTQMPQLVALFNGFGGAASVLVATAALMDASRTDGGLDSQTTVSIVLSALIGAVTFWGSLIAFFKLQGIVVPSGAVTDVRLKIANAIIALASVGVACLIIAAPPSFGWYALLVVLTSVLGVTLVLPIGGADMPVVISLLNSYSGLAACATGFVLNNSVLVISGSLVGASGLILTRIMCVAMNRSLANVIFGGLGAVGDASDVADADEIYAGKVTSASADEIAMLFEGARRVVIVPGYGMAVSQAQHAVRELASKLEERGSEVLFAIHPVAGRMPGHMNVLLAEADVSYEKLKELEEINPMFTDTDVAIVIGANDVVNPMAREDPTSPIAGMPILDVDKARTVVVIKRSLSPGFAGIPNPLFAADNTMMFFSDGKEAVVDLIAALKEL
jgi:NAD(P) transhydrogenase subunit beta